MVRSLTPCCTSAYGFKARSMSSWKSRREAHKLFESVSQLEDLLNKLLVYFLTLFGIIRLSFYLIRSYLLYMTHFFSYIMYLWLWRNS